MEAELAYSLSINLTNIGQTLCQSISGHLISIFVSEFRSLSLSSLSKCPGISDGASDDASNGGRDLENMRYGGGIDEFILNTTS